MISRVPTLVVYVVIPIAGILFFHWDWRPVILLYWLENVTVGILNIVAMSRTQQEYQPYTGKLRLEGITTGGPRSKAFLITFFTVHYGLFTFVHGVFVMLLISGFFSFFMSVSRGSPLLGSLPTAASAPLNFGYVALFWFLGTLVQLILALRQPSEELPAANILFAAPYSRIIVLHLTIIVGTGLILYFGWPPIAALLLVALHFVTDLRKPPTAPSTGMPPRP